MKKKIILTGGGTAGHITPNLALIPFLQEYELYYAGQAGGMEQELIKQFDYVKFCPIPCVKLSRSNMIKNVTVPIRLMRAKAYAKKLLQQIKPDLVFSKGGYVALPLMLAAKDIPLMLHESDYSMGLANKLVAKKCRYACCSFSTLADSLKNGICTGAPLRQSLYSGSKSQAEAECGLRGRKNLLIFGGSLGAKAINECVYAAIDELCKRFDVVHIIGKNNKVELTRDNYYAIPFTMNIANYFAWADLVVSRGGANALFELAALAKPSLVIPLPKGASRGDQIDNANYFASLGFFRTLSQASLTPDTLFDELTALDKDSFRLRLNMKRSDGFDGTKKIIQLINQCLS